MQCLKKQIPSCCHRVPIRASVQTIHHPQATREPCLGTGTPGVQHTVSNASRGHLLVHVSIHSTSMSHHQDPQTQKGSALGPQLPHITGRTAPLGAAFIFRLTLSPLNFCAIWNLTAENLTFWKVSKRVYWWLLTRTASKPCNRNAWTQILHKSDRKVTCHWLQAKNYQKKKLCPWFLNLSAFIARAAVIMNQVRLSSEGGWVCVPIQHCLHLCTHILSFPASFLPQIS